MLRQPDARRVSSGYAFRVALLSGLCLLLFSAFVSFGIGCGSGPFETCLADGDCPDAQRCSAGQCKVQKPVKRPAPEPVADAVVDSGVRESPAPDAVVMDGGGENVPEPPGDSTVVECRSDGDCKNGFICDAQRCTKAPEPLCFPNKHVGVFHHVSHGRITRMITQPKGKLLAVHHDHILSLFDAYTGQLVAAIKTDIRTINNGFWSSDGRFLLIAEQKGNTGLWDRQTGTYKVGPKGTFGAFSADGKSLLRAQETKQLEYVDPLTGKVTKSVALVPPTSGKGTMGSHFSPLGTHFMSFDGFQKAIIWNTTDGKIVAEFAIQTQVQYFGFKGFLNEDLFVVEMAKGPVKKDVIFSISKGGELVVLSADVSHLTLSPQGDSLLYMEKGEFRLAPINDVTKVTNTGLKQPALGVQPSAVAYRPDGNALIVLFYGSNGSDLFSYRVPGFKFDKVFSRTGQKSISMAFHPTDMSLMTTSGDGVAKIWELIYDPKQVTRQLKGLKFFPQPELYRDHITKMRVNVSWSHAVVANDGGLAIWDAAQLKRLHKYDEPGGPPKNPRPGSGIQSLGFQVDGVVSLFEGRALRRWDLASGAMSTETGVSGFNQASLIGVHKSSGVVVTRTLLNRYDDSLSIWEPKSLARRHQLKFKGFLWDAFLAQKQPWLVALTRSRTAEVYDLKSGQRIKTLSIASGNGKAVFGAGDRYFAIRGGVDVEIFDTATWTKIRSISASTDTFTFHPKGQHIAMATISGDVEIYDIKSGKLINTIASKGGLRGIDLLTYHNNGAFLAFASQVTGSAEVWRCAE